LAPAANMPVAQIHACDIHGLEHAKLPRNRGFLDLLVVRQRAPLQPRHVPRLYPFRLATVFDALVTAVSPHVLHAPINSQERMVCRYPHGFAQSDGFQHSHLGALRADANDLLKPSEMRHNHVARLDLLDWHIALIRQHQMASGEAGRSADQNIGRLDLLKQNALCQLGHVAKVRDIGIVVRQNSTWECFNLGKPCGFPTKWTPRHCRSFNAAANRTVPKAHASPPTRTASLASPFGVTRTCSTILSGLSSRWIVSTLWHRYPLSMRGW